ncbi:Pycsar system effector family protein [Streptomyces sp. NPDC021749]|uniref:Pycsar system effector family protein n=1 Tax=Streptomyces sp. NPDC021749 TaxID=3154905 RepID=UPI0033D1DD42
MTVFIRSCPACQSPDTEDYGQPIPHTDDSADCARCRTCGHSWSLDPGANGSCTSCGGSGRLGNQSPHDPRCPCHEDMPQPTPLSLAVRADANLTAQVTTLESQLGRCDSKASLLLALTGALLAGLATSAPSLQPPTVATLIGVPGIAAVLAATFLLLLAVRPCTRGDDRASWPHWARLPADQIRIQLAEDRRAQQIGVLSQLAATKYRRIRIAVDCIISGLGLLTLAAITGAAGA